jgi:Flp pilus assembly protein TadG
MAALISRFRSCVRSEEGAELIEFVIAFPLLMLLIAGILDFGMMMRSYEVVANAAREGARVAVLPDYGETDVSDRVKEYLTASGLDPVHLVEDPTTDTETVTNVAGTFEFSARRVTVNYTYEMAVLSGVQALFGGGIGNVNLGASAVMRHEEQVVTP